MLNEFTKNNVQLPLLYAQIESISPAVNTINYNFSFKVLDTRSKNADNLRDLQSDTAQILTDLRQWFIHNFDTNEIWIEHGTISTMTPVSQCHSRLVNRLGNQITNWKCLY